MKVILNKVNARIGATMDVVAELPEVFTKKMYEELRGKSVDKMIEMNGERPDWRSIVRNKSAYTFDNLRSEGFMVLVKEEKITITVDTFDGYSYDVFDARTDKWERWTSEAVAEVAGVSYWDGYREAMASKGYRIEYNPYGKKEIEAVRNWYRVSENLLDFFDERG